MSVANREVLERVVAASGDCGTKVPAACNVNNGKQCARCIARAALLDDCATPEPRGATKEKTMPEISETLKSWMAKEGLVVESLEEIDARLRGDNNDDDIVGLRRNMCELLREAQIAQMETMRLVGTMMDAILALKERVETSQDA